MEIARPIPPFLGAHTSRDQQKKNAEFEMKHQDGSARLTSANGGFRCLH